MNKRTKAHWQELIEKNSKVKFSLGLIALVCFSLLLLLVSVFTQIPLPNLSIPVEYILHPITYFSDFSSGRIGLVDYMYIPQVPVLFFLSTVLGPVFATLTVIIYIVLGLTPWFPIFALGGGISYFLQYGFGYILSYPFAVCMTAKMLKNDLSGLNIIKSAFLGVILIHLTGCIYLTVIALLKHENMDFILDLIFAQSVTKIFYDYIFSLIVIFVSKFVKKYIWLING